MKLKCIIVFFIFAFLSACGSKTATPIDAVTPAPTLTVEVEETPQPDCHALFNPVGFTADGAGLVGLVTREGGAQTWLQMLDIQSMTAKTILEIGQPVNVASLSPDRRTLAWALPDATIQLVDLNNGRVVGTFSGHKDVVNDLDFSPEGSKLYSGARDATLLVWSLTDGQILHTFQPDGADNLPSEVMGLGVSPDGATLITIPAEGDAKAWDTKAFKKIGEFKGAISGAYNGAQAVFSPDGKYLAIGLAAGPGSVSLWKLADHTQVWSGGVISGFDFSQDGRFFAHTQQTDDNHLQVVIRSVNAQKVLQTIRPTSEDMIWKLLFSPDGARLVSVSNAQIDFWNVEDGTLFKSYLAVCPR